MNVLLQGKASIEGFVFKLFFAQVQHTTQYQSMLKEILPRIQHYKLYFVALLRLIFLLDTEPEKDASGNTAML